MESQFGRFKPRAFAAEETFSPLRSQRKSAESAEKTVWFFSSEFSAAFLSDLCA
jgi:hypothetical protein